MKVKQKTIIVNNKEAQAVKAINLISLLNAQADLSDLSFKKYVSGFGINPHIRMNELADLLSLVDTLRKHTPFTYIFNNFFVGFMINQIGKEFDLLRIGLNSVVNIELKRKSTEEKITKQLIQNEYYLKFLDVKLYQFTYVSSTEKLYMLIDSQRIEEVDFEVLIDRLRDQRLLEIENLHHLFDPINYLVSPFESPEAFLKDEYFLTAQQSTFKREIMELAPVDVPLFLSIEGGPGTGKTLLLYDIAKDYIRKSYGVKIYHCGKLNTGHEKLKNSYSWPIESIPTGVQPISFIDEDWRMYDLIIFDEAQRLDKQHLALFLNKILTVPVKCIFSFDRQQYLTSQEMKNDIPGYLEERLHPKQYELKNIIRCSKEIQAFISNLFDLAKQSNNQKYTNISAQYFSSHDTAGSYLHYLNEEGWKVLDTTLLKVPAVQSEDGEVREDSFYEIIGQDYEEVAVVIDSSFYYNEQNKLSHTEGEKKLKYQQTKLLFQNVTRARKKLHLVLIDNPEVLEKIMNILA